MWETEGVGTRKNHLQSALFMVKRVNFYLLFMHLGNRGSGDSKKSPTKCIIHGQAGKFLLTVFFLADRKKKQKEIFLLTICP